MRILKKEELDPSDCQDVAAAAAQVGHIDNALC
jgi:hypothetical protein